MTPMPEMNDFALRCHVASEAKGWTNLQRTDAQTINLMVSELSEALEDFRDKRGNNEIYYEFKDPDDHLVRDFKVSDMAEWSAEDRGKAKPCGIPIELADCIIRIGQQCGTHRLDLASAMKNVIAADAVVPTVKRTDLNEMIADATFHLSMAWCGSPQSGLTWSVYGPVDRMAMAMWSILYFCEHEKIDIWAAVEEKMAYNATRPHLHGGKAI